MDSGLAPRGAPRNDGLQVRRYPRIKIDPARILLLDQANLPVAPPFLEFFFTGDGRCGIIVDFEPDQFVDAIARGKALDGFGAMLVDAANEISGHAEIERAIFLLARR